MQPQRSQSGVCVCAHAVGGAFLMRSAGRKQQPCSHCAAFPVTSVSEPDLQTAAQFQGFKQKRVNEVVS